MLDVRLLSMPCFQSTRSCACLMHGLLAATAHELRIAALLSNARVTLGNATFTEDLSEMSVRQQEGLANVCLVGRAVTLVRAKVEANLPRKRGAAAAGYDKAINRFYEKVLTAPMGSKIHRPD